MTFKFILDNKEKKHAKSEGKNILYIGGKTLECQKDKKKAGYTALCAKWTKNTQFSVHVWNAEEMSEFYIDLGIISINLVSKSLIMNELPYEEIREKGS